jgi:hypothetical protein
MNGDSTTEGLVQEEDRFSSRRALLITTGAMGVIVLVLLICALLLEGLSGAVMSRLEVQAFPRGAGPREIGGIKQTLILIDRYGLRLRAKQRAALDGYAWVDRDRGIASIPISEAMRLVVEQPQ